MNDLNKNYQIRITWLLSAVISFTSADYNIIFSKSRKREAVYTRMIIWHLLHKHTNLSLDKLSEIFCDHDHTTVWHSLNTFENEYDTNANFRENVNNIEADFKNEFNILHSTSMYNSFTWHISTQVFKSPTKRNNEDIGRVLLGI